MAALRTTESLESLYVLGKATVVEQLSCNAQLQNKTESLSKRQALMFCRDDVSYFVDCMRKHAERVIIRLARAHAE